MSDGEIPTNVNFCSIAHEIFLAASPVPSTHPEQWINDEARAGVSLFNHPMQSEGWSWARVAISTSQMV